MQTKLFSMTFPPTLDPLSNIPTVGAVQGIEEIINQWLTANPGIRISSVNQDLSFQTVDPGFGHLVMSIWYEKAG